VKGLPHLQTRGVLAGAYPKGSKKTMLTHSVTLPDEQPLCSGVKAENIADEYSDPEGNTVLPTCPVCLRRVTALMKRAS
jgi:hypothetical protein